MKKFAKMSLVAAVAVAGMTSASAADLTEAIKNVDVSGMMRYRYTDVKPENGSSSVTNQYDIEVNAKVPVNDIVTANTKLDVKGKLSTQAAPADDKPAVGVEHAYFSFALPYGTINAGKQDVPGPLVDAPNGTGLVGLFPAGPVTVAAGWFNGSGVTPNDIYAAAVMGSFGPVNASLWYGKVKDVADALSAAVDGTVGPVKLDARFSKKDIDALASNDNKVIKVGAEASFGMVTANLDFIKTGDDNGKYGGAALDGEDDAAVNDFSLKQAQIAKIDDATGAKIGVSVSPIEKVSVGAGFLYAEHGSADTKYKEGAVTASYMMSKNFKISSYYSKASHDGNKTDKGRLELKYSF